MAPLSSGLSPGLTATGCFGFLSAFMTLCLIARLVFKLVHLRTARLYYHQVLWLIFNLVSADLLQSIGFLLNITWLQRNAIVVDSPACWSQAWFLSIGNVASGLFTLSIASHTFADLFCNIRLTQRCFVVGVIGLWTLTYALAIIGVGLHDKDFYTRAGAWCWISGRYDYERLYLHYIWILVTEFGTILIYGVLFLTLTRGRISKRHGSIPGSEARVRRAAKALILYPLVYIICTLPMSIARISSMAGRPVGYVQQCVAGAMMASIGWLDVLTYCLTRHTLIFGDRDRADGMRALESFAWGPEEFGTRTIIEAVPRRRSRRRDRADEPRLSGLVELSAHDGLDELHPSDIRIIFTTHTEVQPRVVLDASYRDRER